MHSVDDVARQTSHNAQVYLQRYVANETRMNEEKATRGCYSRKEACLRAGKGTIW